MSENKMSDIIKTSLDGIRDFTDIDSAIGEPIETKSGVTVIPVSKISIGFATGGLDYGSKRLMSTQNFGGGGGTGLSITPMAFLTITKDSDINLIPITQNERGGSDNAFSFLERSPELIQKIKDALT